MEWYYLLILSLITANVHSWAFNDSKAAHEEFIRFYINDGKPLTNLIPVSDQASPIEVLLTLQLYSLDGFDAVSGKLELTGSMYIEWEDQTMGSGTGQNSLPSSKEGYSLLVSPGDIWVPSIRLTNAVDTVTDIGDLSYKVRYHPYDGRMMWHTKIKIQISCAEYVKNFPFDEQTCGFEVTPWEYKSNEVLLDVAQSYWHMCDFVENSVWSLVRTETDSFIENGQSYVKFDITIERYPMYHIFTIVLPVLLLPLMNSFVFVIPMNCTACIFCRR